jgi:hypothetical protein
MKRPGHRFALGAPIARPGIAVFQTHAPRVSPTTKAQLLQNKAGESRGSIHSILKN